jgi:hypothetical protein
MRAYIFVPSLGKQIEPLVSNILFSVSLKAMLSLEIVDQDAPILK